MKHYTYETAVESVTIEVDEMWHKLLLEADIENANTDRKHTRPDHKYAPGHPVSLDSLAYDGEWLANHDDGIAAAALSIDLERALAALTKLQRRYYLLSRIEGFSNAEIARLDGKDESTVREAIKAADAKIKKFFK